MQSTNIDNEKKIENIYTVSRLNSEVRHLLEGTFQTVWVEGEVSNFSAPTSGHWYFCLKDSTAQVRCAMFRGSQRKLSFVPKDGLHVLMKARVSMYENRGEFQLIAEDLEERGEGKLRRAFEILKKKLESAGLFAANKKKPIPDFPRQIGIVTSATGAAVRDILHVLKRRYANVPVIIYHTLVQGDKAAPTIANAIEAANRRNECDVLIIARGGGSLEDLWPFNEEIVANAIYQSDIPIISGVGHEIDFTIADFVADVRAPTPSAAAEIATPDAQEVLHRLTKQKQQFAQLIKQKVTSTKKQLEWTNKHLHQQHPKRQLNEKMQRLDFCEVTLAQLQNQQINQLLMRLKDLDKILHAVSPQHHIQKIRHQLSPYNEALKTLIIKKLTQKQTSLSNSAAKLEGLSPLATLSRGYTITTHKQHVVQKASDVTVGDKIKVTLSQGSLDCVIEKIEG